MRVKCCGQLPQTDPVPTPTSSIDTHRADTLPMAGHHGLRGGKHKPATTTHSAADPLADFAAGCLHQFNPGASEGQPCKEGAWQERPRTFTSLHSEMAHRVEACWEQSLGVSTCKALGEQLHCALRNAPIQADAVSSIAGEKARILTRALALRQAVIEQDPSLAAVINWYKQEHPGNIKVQSQEAYDVKQTRQAANIQRSSNEADPDAAPDQCLLSVCLLLAALFDQSPYGEGTEHRRAIFADFSILKRDFRDDELMVLHGKSGKIEELFDALKDVDRRGVLQNVVGVQFEDWHVSRRVDPFILAEQLDAEVLTLTADGPIGKFKCKLRTLMTLCLLHQRLLKELFESAFAGKPPPAMDVRQGEQPPKAGLQPMEGMTTSDPLDFIDFVEAMARNMPLKLMDNTDLFFAWIYSPEVHASPEAWAQIFGPGANRLPTLFDGVQTPDDAVRSNAFEVGGEHSLDLKTAAAHDYITEGSSMSAVGFPWADDLIGAFLRRVKADPRPMKPPVQPSPRKLKNSPGGGKGGASSAQGAPVGLPSGQEEGTSAGQGVLAGLLNGQEGVTGTGQEALVGLRNGQRTEASHGQASGMQNGDGAEQHNGQGAELPASNGQSAGVPNGNGTQLGAANGVQFVQQPAQDALEHAHSNESSAQQAQGVLEHAHSNSLSAQQTQGVLERAHSNGCIQKQGPIGGISSALCTPFSHMHQPQNGGQADSQAPVAVKQEPAHIVLLPAQPAVRTKHDVGPLPPLPVSATVDIRPRMLPVSAALYPQQCAQHAQRVHHIQHPLQGLAPPLPHSFPPVSGFSQHSNGMSFPAAKGLHHSSSMTPMHPSVLQVPLSALLRTQPGQPQLSLPPPLPPPIASQGPSQSQGGPPMQPAYPSPRSQYPLHPPSYSQGSQLPQPLSSYPSLPGPSQYPLPPVPYHSLPGSSQYAPPPPPYTPLPGPITSHLLSTRQRLPPQPPPPLPPCLKRARTEPPLPCQPIPPQGPSVLACFPPISLVVPQVPVGGLPWVSPIADDSGPAPPAKRGRGRPRKEVQIKCEEEDMSEDEEPALPARRVLRPPKVELTAAPRLKTKSSRRVPIPVERHPNADDTGQLALPLGIFMVGLICSGSFANTQIHVEDLLLMSININMFGAPKVWWWLPREKVQRFKESAELMTEGGRGELYTKSISPFLADRELGIPEQVLPLEMLKELGAKRTIQMPGTGIWTMPGYNFHFTVSIGLNVAESCNMFLEVLGWTFEKLWKARPLEQYPEPADDVARYMKETGILARLGVLECAPLPPALVHRSLRCAITSGTVIAQLDTSQSPCATAADLETATAEAVEAGGSPATAPLPATAQEAGGQDTPIPDAEGGAVQELGPGGMEGVQRQRGAGEDQGQSVAMQPAQPGLKLLRTVYADRVKYAAVAVVQMQGQGAAGGAGVVRGPQPATVGA